MEWYGWLSLVVAATAFAVGAYLTSRQNVRPRRSRDKDYALQMAITRLDMVQNALNNTGVLENEVMGPSLRHIAEELILVRLDLAKVKDE